MDHVSSELEHDADDGGPGRRRTLSARALKRRALKRRALKRASLLALALAFFLLFSGLGAWQVQRRAWKLELIARVDRRVHAAPAPAPGPEDWPRLNRENAEYRRVRVGGVFANTRETLVQAVTDYGAGYWVMTPLVTSWGTVLVNRGFVPQELRSPDSRKSSNPQGPVFVTGLLRMSEPAGAFLHHNAPGAERWYSRDVAAMARARHLANVAPYFIDADATPNPGGWPKGGLTVVAFRNAHLQYAITWFGLALLCAAGAYIVARRQ